MDKKEAHPAAAKMSPYRTLKSTGQTRRLQTLAHALLAGGEISREAIDRLLFVSNGPEMVRLLRKQAGLSNGVHIACTRRPFVDANARQHSPGFYRLTNEGAPLVRSWLEGITAGGDDE